MPGHAVVVPQAGRAPLRRPGAPDRARRAGLRRSASRARRARRGWAVRRLFDRVGIVQIDSVNVLQRAHYLPLFSRAGPYDTDLLDRAAHYAPRRLFEYWGHEASLIPVALQPALRWRMERAADDAWGGMRRIQRDRPDLVAQVLEEVRDERAGGGERGARARAAEADRPVVGLERRQARDGVAVLERADHVGAAARVRAPVRPARARAARRGRRRADAADRGGAAHAAARRRALARRGERVRPARLLPPARRPSRSCACRSSSRRASCCRSRSRAGARRATSIPPRGCRAACAPARSSGRSTRSCGSARARSGSSASATGSRSTCRSPSACTATTCCRSCSATGSWRASTSRPTAAAARCACRPRTPSPTRRRRPRAELRAELESMAGWLGLERLDVVPARRPRARAAGHGGRARPARRRVSAPGAAAVAAALLLALAARADAAPRGVSIVWGGDLTLGSSYGQPPERGWPQLANVAGILRSADVAAVNLRGDVRPGRGVQVRRRLGRELLRVSGAARQREHACPGGRRRRQPGEQPRVRLRAGRLERDARGAARRRRRPHRRAGRGRPW